MPSDFGLPEAKFPEFRDKQLDIALDIVSSDARFRFLDAPCGSGKSLIYMTVAKALNDARTLVLVGTKGLQRQLVGDFEKAGMFLVQGQSNYPCIKLVDAASHLSDPRGTASTASKFGRRNYYPPDSNCDHGPCKVGVKCPLRQGGCNYYDAIYKASKAQIVVSNYAQWLSLSRHSDPNALGKFDLLICDEAHDVPRSWLPEFCSIELDRNEVRTIMDLDLPAVEGGIAEWAAWGRKAAAAADAMLAEFQEEIKDGHRPSNDETKRMLRVQRLSREFHALARAHGWKSSESSARAVMSPGNETDWVGQETAKGRKFSPVWVHTYAEETLFRNIPNVVLSSATLSPAVAKYLGVPQSQSSWHEMPSSFPRRRRPFIICPIVRVDFRMGEGEKRMWMNRIDTIIEPRLDRKGIIHSVSYARAHEIAERSKFGKYMMLHDSRNFREVVEKFMQADAPAILVSPSVAEGFDFAGDLCRWQILSKVPFPDGRDLVFKARNKSDKGYGNYCAALAIMQMTGRSTRSKRDWSEVFIIDEHFGWMSRRVKWARWFKESWQWKKLPPSPLQPIAT